jgi:putative MATE family efflux protein
MSLRVSVLISAAFTAAALFLPSLLMRLFTSDLLLITLGARYLRVIAVGYLFMGVSQMLLAAYKSMEQTKVSALISSACLFVNVGLNAISIFLLFPGNEAMAVVGVAAATALSRLIELILCLLWSRKPGNARVVWKHVQRVKPWLKADFWRYTRPVLLNYLIWGGALTVTSSLTGHISTAMVSASSIAISVRNLATVACTGFAGGGGILLGKLLGAKRLAAARTDGRRLTLGSLLLGVVAGGLVLALRPLCLLVVPMETETRALLDAMLVVCAAYCVGKSFNSTLVGGIFCAGGDTKFGLICDAVVMWGIILPLGFLCAFVWHGSPIVVFMVLCMDEYVKMPFVAWHYRKHLWLHNLTRDTQ